MSHTYSTGSNVSYDSKCCTIFKLRTVEGQPAYLIREIVSGTVHDNVLESNISTCDISEIITMKWNGFVYNGNNSQASNWVFDNIIKNIANASDLSWGPNADSTSYTFSTAGNTWTKAKTA